MKFSATASALVFMAATTLSVWSQAPAVPAPTMANVPYGTHERQVLDFYQASPDKVSPVLFYIHGGGWIGGDKASPDFVPNCLAAGISVVSISYRFIQNATEAKIDPPVLAPLEDAARALQFVRNKATEWKIDGTRIGSCGGSAGGFSALWLAFHPDMADPKSSDPVSRESTRVSFSLTFAPQTSLDPRQMREWLPNNDYGYHAFGLASFQEFIDKRESLLPWIKQFSPYELATSDDPPTFLYYDSTMDLGKPAADPPHSANFGAGLVEKLKSVGIEYQFQYAGAPPLRQPDLMAYMKEKLKITP